LPAEQPSLIVANRNRSVVAVVFLGMEPSLRTRAPLRAGLSASPYELHRDYVLRVLGSRCSWLDSSDREALFHDAYAVFLEKQRSGQLDARGMRQPQVRAYLTQTALNKAMDEGKRAGRRRSVSLDDEDLGIDPADPSRDLDERLAASFEDARVREIVDELPERQQLVIKLRFFYERTPAEIQSYMGVTERVYRRELERATHQLAERFGLLRAGRFCDSRRSLMLAYATGVAGPNRVIEARRHLDSCPGCAHWVRELRSRTRQAAAIVPLPAVLPVAHTALAAAALGHRLHARIVHLTVHSRAHAARLLTRPDPDRFAALTSARPGALAVVVSGCLAAGSSATYCVVHGLPAPLRSLVAPNTVVHTHHHQHPPHDHPVARVPIVTPAPPATTSLPAPVSHPAASHTSPTSHSRPTSRTRPASPSRPVVHRHELVPARATAHTDTVGRRQHQHQVQSTLKATAPEFGLGGGTPTTAAPSQPSHPASTPVHQPVQADTASSHGSTTSSQTTSSQTTSASSHPSSGSSQTTSGTARATTHTTASQPLPEFDP
jgi:RNA polymerase sigma factor (sigma-70 family)